MVGIALAVLKPAYLALVYACSLSELLLRKASGFSCCAKLIGDRAEIRIKRFELGNRVRPFGRRLAFKLVHERVEV